MPGPMRGGPGSRGMKSSVENPGKILLRLMKFVARKYLVQCLIVFACIIIGVLANVQGTLFMKTLIDSYIVPMLTQAEPDFLPLAAAIGRVAGFYLIGIGATFTYTRIMVYVTQGTLRELRDTLFSHMEKLPIRYFDTHAHGDIMSIYTNDIDTLRQMLSQSIPQLINSAFTIVSVLFSMILLDIPLTLVTLGMVGLMLAATRKLAGLSGTYFIAQQKEIGQLNGYVEEIMAGEKVVKVFCHEEETIRDFKKLNDQLFESVDKANRFANILMPTTAQLGNISYVICAIVGGILAINGVSGLTLGGLASFLAFNKSFNMPINQVSMQLNSVIMALAGADRIFQLMDEPIEEDQGYVSLVNAVHEEGVLKESQERTGLWAWKYIQGTEKRAADGKTEAAAAPDKAAAVGKTRKAAAIDSETGSVSEAPGQAGLVSYRELKGDVRMEDVSFGYVPEKIVLHDVSLFAKPGQKIAFVGSTGAGKTTITNLLNRFYDIQEGQILIDGIDMSHIRKGDLRRSLGMVLQDTCLFTGTVRENIRFGKLDATDQEVEAAARLANADTFIKRLPQGYDTVLSGNGSSLSQGQRQLLAIARAAIADPPVLILDEATSSIDTRTERIVQDGMDKLMKGRTTFVIAHRLSTVRNADCIMVLEQGRIIERGTHSQLIEEKGKYYQLYTGHSGQGAVGSG